MSATFPFSAVARLPSPADNVAVATCQLEPGSRIDFGQRTVQLPHTVLLGHRFAVRPIAVGEALTSWTRPFGVSVSTIAPGDYVCNAEMLAALAYRKTGATLPARPNFESRIVSHVFDESGFSPAPQIEHVRTPATFLGYRRPGGRGVGTRNYIVILGTSSRTAGVARRIAEHLQPLAHAHPGIDGIVAAAHTEGGDPHEPNNMPELLQALGGYIVHPNVAAIVALDYGVEPLNNARLREWLEKNNYPVAHVPHAFLTIRNSIRETMTAAENQVRAWLPTVAADLRTEEPLAGLCAALQCGGSDAFSGISGNPLAGAVGHEVIRHGGRMCLTETDELIGAEGYILERVRDLDTARRFLAAIERFKTRLSWHGCTAEGNPSAGNKLRGLYNITLKSLGAAAKKSPLTRLDHVVDYAQRMSDHGFYFMDGPGNDLEGIAGQAAGGCNLFLFVTGNGSVTNFPFIPTIKITTTTARHELLHNEMDVNAGRYLDGESMDALRDETFEFIRAVASGRRTKGELAGHSQIQVWRNWRQTDASRLEQLRARPEPSGMPLRLAPGLEAPPLRDSELRRGSFERIGLVLPASLCSGQVARMAAARLNERLAGGSIDRFVALAHTEGCGFTGESLYRMLLRTYRGYLTHPSVEAALVLEHGCEKVPNDMIRRELTIAGVDPHRFGWASVQLDGGIERVLAVVEHWFAGRLAQSAPRACEPAGAGLGALTLGMVSESPMSEYAAKALTGAVRAILRSGGSVLVPAADALARTAPFSELLADDEETHATLAGGEPMVRRGLHLVDTESEHLVENITALAGSGSTMILATVLSHPCPGHPLVPVLQVAERSSNGRIAVEDVDHLISGGGDEEATAAILRLITTSWVHEYNPVAAAAGVLDFQITRGLLGVTT